MNTWFFKAVNAVIFFLGLLLVMVLESERSESYILREEQVVSQEAAIPHKTLTTEDEIELFFKRVRNILSDVSRDDIIESISPWESYIRRYSAQYGVDADLVRAIIYAESKGDPFTISRNGALGLMQIMPETADFIGINNPLDPEENIKAGIKYITWLIRNGKRNEDPYLLWAWNAGLGTINKGRMPGETKRFIAEVLSVKNSLREDRGGTI